MGNRYHGKRGRVYMSSTGATVAVAMVSLSEWTLDMSTDKAETTCFEDGNKTFVQGYSNREGTISGFFDSSNDGIFDASESSSGTNMYLYQSLDCVGQYFYGPAWLDVSITCGVNDAVKISGRFSANGTWGRQGAA